MASRGAVGRRWQQCLLCTGQVTHLPTHPPPGVSDHDLLFSKKEREAPPGSSAGRTFTGSAAAGGRSGGSSGATAGRGGAAAGPSPRKGVFSKAASQGWSGGSELSDLFAKRLSISGSGAATAAAAQPPGASWGSSSAAAPTSHGLSGGGSSHACDLQQ